MGIAYDLYSPLSATEAIALVETYDRAVNDYLDEHPDTEDEHAEVEVAGPVPTREDVIAGHRYYDLPVPDEVLRRLERCRSALRIDRPRYPYSPLQVAAFRFLLERVGEGLCLLNDFPPRLTEEFVEDLKRERGVRGFGTPPHEVRRRPVKQRAPRPGEVRALRLHGVLVQAASDPSFAIDVRDALARASEPAQRYAALLLEDGAMSDPKAARSLGWSRGALEDAAASLEASLRRLLGR